MDLLTMFKAKYEKTTATPSDFTPLAQSLQTAIASLTENERYEYEERAAIMEYDGVLPREEAERLALEIVRKRRTEE